MRNKFCDAAELRNEADVEQNFVRRLLEDLGYSDREILPKQSLDDVDRWRNARTPAGTLQARFRTAGRKTNSMDR